MLEDTQELRPANENPWYVLMTLYGEDVLANREAWNTWASFYTANSALETYSTRGSEFPSRDTWHKASLKIGHDFRRALAARCPNHILQTEPLVPPSRLKFDRLRFDHELDLSGFLIPCDLTFTSCVFKEQVELSNICFSGHIDLNNCTFDKNLRAWSVTSLQNLSLSFCSFGGKADFLDLYVSADAYFDHLHFRSINTHKAYLGLSEGVFRGDLSLRDIRFADVSLPQTKVENDLDLSSSDFTSIDAEALFVKGKTRIYDATFRERAYFNNAKFDEDVIVTKSNFRTGFDLNAATVKGRFTLQHCFVHSRQQEWEDPHSTFEATQFQGPIDLRGTGFTSHYPSFHGAILHGNFLVTPSENLWPKGACDDVHIAKASCATIRHAIAKQGLPEDEHFFFRREMYFASKIGHWHQRLPYLIFGAFSDYGHSIRRPTYWLLTLWLFGFLAFGGYFASCCAVAPSEALAHPYGTAAAFSFSNLLPPFGFSRLYFNHEFVKELPTAIKAYSGLQTVFSLPLLFFLGLALRQRFRLR